MRRICPGCDKVVFGCCGVLDVDGDVLLIVEGDDATELLALEARDLRTASGQANQTGIFGGQAYSDGTGIFNIRPLLCVQTALFHES